MMCKSRHRLYAGGMAWLRDFALRRRELERALKQLARGEAPEVVVEHLSQALTNKFLHDPMSTLREAGGDAEHARLQALLARFYSHPDD